MAASALLKNAISTEEWMAATTFVKKRNILLKKNVPWKRKKRWTRQTKFLGTADLDYSLFL